MILLTLKENYKMRKQKTVFEDFEHEEKTDSKQITQKNA